MSCEPVDGDFKYTERDSMKVLLLCVFLGWLGIHRFYCGRKISGFLYLFSLGFCGIGIIVDMFSIAYGKFDYHGKYYGYDYAYALEETSRGGKMFCWITGVVVAVILILPLFAG